LHAAAGQQLLDNPFSRVSVLTALEDLAADYGTCVSDTVLAITGGEPLLQADFLCRWLPDYPGPKLLETAGILPDPLKLVLPHLDFLSLDWKDPADLPVGVELLASAECLQLAVDHQKQRPEFRYWTKLILGAQSCLDWLGEALQTLARLAPQSTVFLQPVSPQAKGPQAPASADLLHTLLQWRHLPLELRVVPQMHPLLGVR
jgi:7-carboxy-7-deazaguanine synthase